ncbi:MAG TPA: hypothetical protein PLV25_01565, partial [Opitutales bacterium]|nr:hypothetical protein [Opitutales bacterium]
MRGTTLEEDIALKQFTRAPFEQKPSYNWREAVDREGTNYDGLSVTLGTERKPLTPYDIADIIGTALSDLLLSRDEKNIFTTQNQKLVARATQAAADALKADFRGAESVQLSRNDLYALLEKVLVKQHAFDMARSLV